ncbi:MAG: efflux RND transporter periplasmic adaptor subunit [Pseudomonadota bacterium]
MRFIAMFTAAVLLPVAALAAPGPALEAQAVELVEVPREYRLDGVVEAVKQSTVAAQTSGQVEEVLFDVDDLVSAGQPMVRLRDTEQRARLSQAEAQAKEAGARLEEARENFERTEKMFARDLVAEAAMDTAQATLEAAQAQSEAAEAAVQQAREQLEYTLVVAPYSGIVTHRHVEVGEIASPGQALMSGISLDEMRVAVDVPQSLVPRIRNIRVASVELPGDGYADAAKITVFPFADHASNTFKVRLDLPPGTPNLFPGMFVKTAFVTGSSIELVVPQEAVVYRSEVTGVYVVDEKGRVTLRHVRLGRELGDGSLVVLAGLEPGERVALDPIAAGVQIKRGFTDPPDGEPANG